MLIEDLMAGDYVYNDKKQICKVCSINAIGIPYTEADNLAIDDGCFTLLYDYSGIPLTAEILKKNGFVKVENMQTSTIIYSFRDTLFRIGVFDFNHVTIDSYYTDSSCDVFISSVHELQHALRLCGINKEIKL